jgi:hypothetical protein
LSVFVDGEEWIAWTPAGYYDCSPGGERMMGWIVNQPQEVPEGAEGQKPAFFVAEQLNQKLFRPDILGEFFRAGDLEGALNNVGVQNNERVENPAQLMPPKVEIIQPHDRDILVDQPPGDRQTKPQLKVRARATAAGKGRVTGMRLQIDGKNWQGGLKGTMKNVDLAPPPEAARESANEMTWLIDDLMPGKSEIKVFAQTDDGLVGESDPLFITYRTSQPPPSPTLYAVCIGISKYSQEHLKLKYAHLDATKVAQVLKTESKKVFENPPQIKVILDQQARKEAILEGLAWLLDKMEQQDVGVFFFSGHGQSIAQNESQKTRYLVPWDFKPDNIQGSCVSEQEFRKICRSRTRKGDLVVLLDACHSGGIHLDDLVRVLKRGQFGMYTFASSQGDEKSWELDNLKAGVFAHYLVEGLKGAADAPNDSDTEVVIGELGNYVAREVQDATRWGDDKKAKQRPSVGWIDYYLSLTKK